MARCRLTGFQKRTSATQFLSAPGTTARLSAADANSTLALREIDGLAEAPLPTCGPCAVADTSVSRPVSASAMTMLLTPLPLVSTRSVAAVRKATCSPLSLIAGWSEGPLPAFPDGLADTRRVRVRTPPWLRNVCS